MNSCLVLGVAQLELRRLPQAIIARKRACSVGRPATHLQDKGWSVAGNPAWRSFSNGDGNVQPSRP